MEFKILRESKGVVIAEFMNEPDRDDCFDFLQDKYDDAGFVRANGDRLEEL